MGDAIGGKAQAGNQHACNKRSLRHCHHCLPALKALRPTKDHLVPLYSCIVHSTPSKKPSFYEMHVGRTAPTTGLAYKSCGKSEAQFGACRRIAGGSRALSPMVYKKDYAQSQKCCLASPSVLDIAHFKAQTRTDRGRVADSRLVPAADWLHRTTLD